MAEVIGTEKLIAQLKQARDAKLRNLKIGVNKAGAFLLRESLKIVPRETGALARSGRSRIGEESTKVRPVNIVSYGTDYAIYVHEIPDPPTAHGASFNIKHLWEYMSAKTPAEKAKWRRAPEQQYKFLEKPAREKRKEIRDIIVSEVAKNG